MSHERTRREKLTQAEVNAVREIVEKHGPKRAAELLGLGAEATVWKALAGAEVHSLTASTVRANLAALKNRTC